MIDPQPTGNWGPMTILEARPEHTSVNDTLGLVASGRVARECGVQIAMIDLFCRRGANPGRRFVAGDLRQFQAFELLAFGAGP